MSLGSTDSLYLCGTRKRVEWIYQQQQIQAHKSVSRKAHERQQQQKEMHARKFLIKTIFFLFFLSLFRHSNASQSYLAQNETRKRQKFLTPFKNYHSLIHLFFVCTHRLMIHTARYRHHQKRCLIYLFLESLLTFSFFFFFRFLLPISKMFFFFLFS